MITLYSTLDDVNVINKTMVFLKDFNIRFKEKFSITSPQINLRITDDFNIHQSNYCYISEFNRYYFIQDIQMISDDIYVLILECDVLESFKNDILSSVGEISKPIQEGDYPSISTNNEVRKEIDIFESDLKLNLQKSIIVSTIGGSE